MTQPLALSIVVPAHDAAHFLPRCLDALTSQVVTGDEIVVADDASTDDTREVAQRPGVRLVTLPRQRGASAARNAGVAASTNPLLLFVDADVVVAPDVLAKIRAHFEKHPGDTGLFGSYDARPDAPGLVSQYRNLLHHFVHQRANPRPSHFWTGLGALRREAFDAVGGFDETQLMMDVELGYRLRRAGHALTLDPSLQGTHLKRWTLAGMLYTDVFIRAIPWTRLLLSARNVPDDFSLGRGERLSVILAWLLLACLILSIVRPTLLAAALAILAAFIVVNRGFLAFLARERSVAFAAGAVALHLLYSFSCGVGAMLGAAAHLTGAST